MYILQRNLVLLNVVGIIEQLFHRKELQCKAQARGKEVSRITKTQRRLRFVSCMYIYEITQTKISPVAQKLLSRSALMLGLSVCMCR